MKIGQVTVAALCLRSLVELATGGTVVPTAAPIEEDDEDYLYDEDGDEDDGLSSWYPYDPDVWALDESSGSETCRSGDGQSPVDLPSCAWNVVRPEINISWGKLNVTFTNDGNSIVLDLTADADVPTEAPTEAPTPSPTKKRKLRRNGQARALAERSKRRGETQPQRMPRATRKTMGEREASEDRHLADGRRRRKPIGTATRTNRSEKQSLWIRPRRKRIEKANSTEGREAARIIAASIADNMQVEAMNDSTDLIERIKWTRNSSRVGVEQRRERKRNLATKATTTTEAPDDDDEDEDVAAEEDAEGYDYDDDGEDEEMEMSLGQLIVSGRHYNLLRCSFHWPSEHTIEGEQQAMNMDCLHRQNKSSRFLILSVFYQVGEEADEFLSLFEDFLPSYTDDEDEEEEEDASEDSDDDLFEYSDEDDDEDYYGYYYYNEGAPNELDFNLALNGTDLTNYWTYAGSFTTPPCAENVDWYILMGVRSLTEDQLGKFQEAIGWEDEGGNFRPTQPLNDRTIDGCGDIQLWYPYDAENWAFHVGDDSDEICQNGRRQSPVVLPRCDQALARPSLGLSWGRQLVELEHDGHTVTITPADSTGALLTIFGNRFALQKCAFHWGSEHWIGGEQTPLAMHCTHLEEGTEDHIIQLSIFYVVGKSQDSFLAELEDILPMLPEMTAQLTLDLDAAYRGLDLSSYWSYAGSLTTPPCTEGVDWHILMQRKTISASQLLKFKDAIGWTEEGGNNRPPQERFEREIIGCMNSAQSRVDKGALWIGMYIGAAIAFAVCWVAHVAFCIFRFYKRQRQLRKEQQLQQYDEDEAYQEEGGAQDFEEVVPSSGSPPRKERAR